MSSERRTIVIAGLAYFCVGLWLASHFGTWSDEEYTLATTAHGAAYAFHRAITYELQAPVYFVVLALWRELDQSVGFARLFSLLCATLFFFATAAISKRLAPTRSPLPFALLCALNPYVVFDALEIRLYALDLFLCASLWLAFDAGFWSGASRRARIVFAVLAIVGIGVQYFVAFMLVGLGVALLVRGNRRALVAYAAYGIVVSIAVLPLALIARSQASISVQIAESPLQILYLTALHPWLEFLFPHPYMTIEPKPEHAFYVFVALGSALCCVLMRPNVTRSLVAWICAAGAINLLYIALAVSIPERLGDRYFAALFVPCAVAVYALVLSARALPAIWARVFVGTIAILTTVSLVTQYRFLAQEGDWPRVAAYLAAHAAPDDAIAIYPSEALPAFARQYRGSARVVPFPRPNPSDRYVLDAVDVHSKADARDALARIGTYRRLWLVDAINCNGGEPNSYGCDDLHDVLSEEFTTLDRSQFYMNSVVELARRTSSAPKTQQAVEVTPPR